jgi:two-component system, response regulator YesN
MPIFSNLLAPLISGIFFLLYFIYFAIANPSKTASYKYFVVFLISLSAFSLGRPLQLILGPHPIPLIIVNIRVFLLCSVISPVIILASDLFTKQRRKSFEAAIVSVCALLGLTYVVFNVLGTKSSRILFHFSGIAVQDNLTPSMLPPFFGREVTIGVQVLTGLLLMFFSLLKLIKLKLKASARELLKNKIFLFNSGVFIFAISFIVGSIIKQWGIYYTAFIVSALLFGWSVLIDVKEVHHYYEKLIPFIKEDIIDNVAFGDLSKMKLTEMLDCLGKGGLNTFAIIKIRESGTEIFHGLKATDEAAEIASRRFSGALNEEGYLLLPLSKGRIGIAVRQPDEGADARKGSLLEILEGIQTEISAELKRDSAIGIGRTYGKTEDLRSSYREASNAQEYAERFEASSIVHVDDINEPDRRSNRYPAKEKEKLLSSIKLGDTENIGKALADFMAAFKPFITERPDVLKVRLYEFVGSVIDAAIVGGGDEKKLNERIAGYFDDIDHVKDMERMENWMAKVVKETAAIVVRIHEKRSKSLIKSALKYIEENHKSPLSYRDVAKEVSISPSYFLCLFKQETGLTFVDHLTDVRIARAKALLRSTEMSVTEIAREVGFHDANYFSSIFKKSAGLTAKEFRART